MQTTIELFRTARAAMVKWPVVWLPPFMISALQLMASGPYTSSVAQLVVFMTSTLGMFIIDAGWLALIRDALQD